MSANLVVDLGATCDYKTSISVGSGSDLTVGAIVDLLGANTYCNVFVNGGLFGSGLINVRVQTSDTTTSGSFTDPTSGLPAGAFPTTFQSGGQFFANSGLWVSGYSSPAAPVNNAPLFCSGGTMFGAFQRPHRYARLILDSGTYPNPINAGFISNKKTIGSGGGSTQAPGSGTVQV